MLVCKILTKLILRTIFAVCHFLIGISRMWKVHLHWQPSLLPTSLFNAPPSVGTRKIWKSKSVVHYKVRRACLKRLLQCLFCTNTQVSIIILIRKFSFWMPWLWFQFKMFIPKCVLLYPIKLFAILGSSLAKWCLETAMSLETILQYPWVRSSKNEYYSRLSLKRELKMVTPLAILNILSRHEFNLHLWRCQFITVWNTFTRSIYSTSLKRHW